MSKQANRGKAGSIRGKALKAADLAKMEAHGKREDESGKKRRVRETAPLVYESLEIRELCAAHMKDVTRSSGAKTKCVHALVQYPTDLIDAKDEQQQVRMLDHAVHFLNRYHGGDAVFAARLDRDEKGRHSVDVFLMPRYDFEYKDGRKVKKASVSKFSKQHSRARFPESLDKDRKPRLDSKNRPVPRDDRRAQGSALQHAWFEYMRDEMKIAGVMPPESKKWLAADRVEPEVLGLKRDRERHLWLVKDHHDTVRSVSKNVKAVKQKNRDQAAKNAEDAEQLVKDRAAFNAERKKAAPALAAAQQAAESRKDQGRVEELQSLRAALRGAKKKAVEREDR